MILWHKIAHHPSDFVERLEQQIISQHNSSRYFTTYNDDTRKNDPLLDADLIDHIENFYPFIVQEMLKDVGIFGHLDYTFKRDDVYWVQMYNENTTAHTLHNHHGSGAFLSWVHVVKALPTQKTFFFANSRGQKMYPPHQDTSDIFAFPSWALHGVDKVIESGVNRIIIAGNVHLN